MTSGKNTRQRTKQQIAASRRRSVVSAARLWYESYGRFVRMLYSPDPCKETTLDEKQREALRVASIEAAHMLGNVMYAVARLETAMGIRRGGK